MLVMMLCIAYVVHSVLDMLRFHKFTIGHAWITEFGSADSKEEFDWLIKSVLFLCYFLFTSSVCGVVP